MKEESTRVRLLAYASILLIGSLLGATIASAQTQSYYLAGAFGRGEGVVVRLPVIGNSNGALCGRLEAVARLGAGTQATTPPITTAPSPALPGGCIPGQGQVVSVNTGGPRASFMLPTSFFSQPEDDVPNRILVPIPGIVSLTTDLNFYGPLATGPFQPRQVYTGPNQTGPDLTPVTAGVAVWNQFREGAWTTQTGRAGLSFTWCNGNSNCLDVNGGQGGIMKYSASTANGFGGTASVVLAPGDVAGSLPIIGGAQGAGGPNSLLLVPVQDPPPPNGNGGGPGDLGGKGYANIARNQAGNATVFQSFMIGTDGFISGLTNPLFTIPGTVNTSHQMPWTTGMVLVRAVLPTGMGNPNTFTFAQSGNDARTAMGEGNIQLVAGSMRRASGSDTLTPHFNGMSLAFVPEPGVLGMVAAGGLFVFGMTRRRRA